MWLWSKDLFADVLVAMVEPDPDLGNMGIVTYWNPDSREWEKEGLFRFEPPLRGGKKD